MTDLTELYRNKYHYNCINVSLEASHVYKSIKRLYNTDAPSLSELLYGNAMRCANNYDFCILPSKLTHLDKRRNAVRVSDYVFDRISHIAKTAGISKGVVMTYIIILAKNTRLPGEILQSINSLESQIRR